MPGFACFPNPAAEYQLLHGSELNRVLQPPNCIQSRIHICRASAATHAGEIRAFNAL
jgi:hypothetical protein